MREQRAACLPPVVIGCLLFQLIKYLLGPSVGTRPRALVGAGSEMIVCNVLTCYKGVLYCVLGLV